MFSLGLVAFYNPWGSSEQCNNYENQTCTTTFSEEEVNDLWTAVPNTECEYSSSQEICLSFTCPAIIKDRDCEAKEVLDIEMVPKTVCELKEISICEDIAKEVPSLTIANECRYIPIEKCSDDDVPAIEVINPVVKKVLFTRAIGFQLHKKSYLYFGNHSFKIKFLKLTLFSAILTLYCHL